MSLQTLSTPELDALARAAEEAAELSANESELSHSKGRRTKRAKIGSGAGPIACYQELSCSPPSHFHCLKRPDIMADILCPLSQPGGQQC